MKATDTKPTAKPTSKPTPFFSKESGQDFFGGNGSEAAFFSKTNTISGIQPKLTIGQPNDKYEVEADAMADMVVKRLNEPKKIQPGPIQQPAKINPLVQAQCATCEKEEKQKNEEETELPETKLQKKPVYENMVPAGEETVQRKCATCEKEERLQRQAESGSTPASTGVESSLAAAKGSGSPLPDATRQQMENSFGADFSNVRLHTNSSAVQMNKDLKAQAFTHGSDIFFNEGKYNTNDKLGKHLLAHELTHVVQQNNGIFNDKNTALNSGNEIVQRSFWDDIRAEAKRKKEKQEKADLEHYLNENKPGTLKTMTDVGTLVKQFIDKEDITKPVLNILRARNAYLLKELGKVELWLTQKPDLSDKDREKLNIDKNEIILVLSTPFSLNPNVDVSKLSVAELGEEYNRIAYWISSERLVPGDEHLIDNLRKINLLIRMNEDPPVFWGIDLQTSKRYINVKFPGYKLQTIAFYLYGDPLKSGLITNMDGSPAAEFIEAGTSLAYDVNHSLMTALASAAKLQLKSTGQDLNMQGQNEQISSVVLADKTYNVTSAQLKVLLSSMFNTERNLYKIELEYLQDQLKVYTNHKKDTNWAVRSYSDTFGGAAFDAEYYRERINLSKTYLQRIEKYSETEATPELVNALHKKLSFIRGTGEMLTKELMQYMNNTVEGASKAITVLEGVKMAGNIAASFVPGLGIVYGGIQDTAQQVSGLAHGTQEKWDFKSTRNNFALGLVSHGVGKGLGAIGQGAGKMIAKYLPGLATKASAFAKNPIFTGSVGKIMTGTAKNIGENVVSSPILQHVDKLLTKGRFANYDEIINDLGEQFSLKNLALAGTGAALHGKIPGDIHIAGKNKKSLPTVSDTFKPASKGNLKTGTEAEASSTEKSMEPLEDISLPPVTPEEPIKNEPAGDKSIPSKPAQTPGETAEQPSPQKTGLPTVNKADIISEKPVRIGNEDHEAVVTKKDAGICSEDPCIVIAFEYQNELKIPEYAAKHKEIQDLRIAGKYEDAAQKAADLIQELEAVRAKQAKEQEMQTPKDELGVREEPTVKTPQKETPPAEPKKPIPEGPSKPKEKPAEEPKPTATKPAPTLDETSATKPGDLVPETPEARQNRIIQEAEGKVKQRQADYDQFGEDAKKAGGEVKLAKDEWERAPRGEAKRAAKRKLEKAKADKKFADEMLEMAKQDVSVAKSEASQQRQVKLAAEAEATRQFEEPVRKVLQSKRQEEARVNKQYQTKAKERDKLIKEIDNIVGSKMDDATLKVFRDKNEHLKKVKTDIEGLGKKLDTVRSEIATRSTELANLQAVTLRKVEILQAEIREGRGISRAHYEMLRGKTPSGALRKKYKNVEMDSVYPNQKIVGTPEPDHIVSMHEITQMEGFNRLTEKQQLEVLNHPGNFMALDKRVNGSKGDRSFSQWDGYPPFGEIPIERRKKLLDKETEAREAIKKAIQDRDPLHKQNKKI